MGRCRSCGSKWILVTIFAVGLLMLKAVEASHHLFTAEKLLQEVPPSTISNRTAFHFQAFKNWINDPNGPMYYNGVYHLFYQFNPKQPIWGNIIWAHSVSKDLINWKPLKPAIYPTGPFDINGCWSGSATILPGNKPAILYTGIDSDNRQVQNIAFPKNLSDPYLQDWVKPDYNPVISPDHGINSSAFRDPTTAWPGSDGRWRLVVGSRRDSQGMAILYSSEDFRTWRMEHNPLHVINGTGMWECPDFFPVSSKPFEGVDNSVHSNGLKHVFKVSLDVDRYEYYTIGTYDYARESYVPDGLSSDNNTGLRFDYGNFYASKTFYDGAKRRRILLGWSNESDSNQDDWAKGWAGIHTIPRALWLSKNGRQVVQWPVHEVKKLRHKHVAVYGKKLSPGDIFEIQGIQASQADVEVTFDASSSLENAEQFDPSWTNPQKLCSEKGEGTKGGVSFGLYVLATGDKRERTSVFFRIFKAKKRHVVLFCHDPTRSSFNSRLYKPIYGGFVDVEIQNHGKISLRSLIDHSVVESFAAGGKTCITSRVYPSFASGSNARLFAFNNGDGEVEISQLKAWEMRKPYINGI
ncbi:hypothetical protein HPP92_008811 [Vanilla planifolia]|uniref:Uncharacterized protein n=1 Tax=Vanilla planifolia TaxID=51239 RepID=A0A835V889_VANPL|nr:hypothetical protein HPP92_009041 [Vanilla planifolia]KAG0486716.1 hypothetical protein HPP92_008811 [Vanilla planifolia]